MTNMTIGFCERAQQAICGVDALWRSRGQCVFGHGMLVDSADLLEGLYQVQRALNVEEVTCYE